MGQAKLIQRFATWDTGTSIAAGTYAYTVVPGLTPRFNMIVNSITCGIIAKDNVTDMMIEAQVRMIWGGLSQAYWCNPGVEFSAAAAEAFPQVFAATAKPNRVECYVEVPANYYSTFNVYVNLATVTVNAIRIDTFVTFGYLCPEDYLSVDGFAVSPG